MASGYFAWLNGSRLLGGGLFFLITSWSGKAHQWNFMECYELDVQFPGRRLYCLPRFKMHLVIINIPILVADALSHLICDRCLIGF